MDKKIKILVGYHKPAVLLKSDILEPIHLGRDLLTKASKDGKMSQEDYQWMLDNMFGDNTGDNISSQNLFFNELTALYWAWKNYAKLGNPDYIGFMHYRRHLCFDLNNTDTPDKYGLLYADNLDSDYIDKYKINDDVIKTLLNDNDVLVAEKTDLVTLGTGNVYNHYKTADPKLHVSDLDFVVDLLSKVHPEYKESVDEYLQSRYGYFTNIFVMPKNLFFEYCEWLFNILFACKHLIKQDVYNIQEIRVLGYISEWLFGIFLTHQKKSKNLKICELKRTFIRQDDIINLPNYRNEAYPIVFSVDNNYLPYLAVAIRSLIDNIHSKNQYEIFILEDKLSKANKTKIQYMETENVKITFIPINSYIENFDSSIFYLCDHFSISAYFRFFIPQIFKNFDKLLYCDCDAIFLKDPAELFDIDLQDNWLGVVHDTEAIRYIFTNKKDNYYTEKLKLKNPKNYFQSGFLLMNIPKLLEVDFEKKCIDKLKEIKTPRYVDQCILNFVCEDNVLFLDASWNVENHLMIFNKDISTMLPYKIYVEYLDALKSPKFLHFSGCIKPWQDPSSYNAHLFWEYARKTIFYEEIIYRNQKSFSNVVLLPQKKFYKNFLQKIFSMKTLKVNNKTFKVVTILGIRIKFKRRKK